MHRRIAPRLEVGRTGNGAVEIGTRVCFVSEKLIFHGEPCLTQPRHQLNRRSIAERTSPMMESSAPHDLQLYVDGSYDPIKRIGGWGVVVLRNNVEVASRSGSIGCADSSAPELLAILEALHWLDENTPSEAATIWSDSTYAVTGCNRWRHIWRTNHWRKRAPNGKGRSRDVSNVDHWKALDTCLTRCDRIDVAWCKGHVGLEWNERADTLARRAIQRATVVIAVG